LFVQGQYQIRRMKLHRIQQIEYFFSLKQNYYWEKGRSKANPTQGIYRTYGPGGNVVTEILYSVISFGFPFFGLFKLFTSQICNSRIFVLIELISFLIPIFTLIWYDRKANQFNRYMDEELKQNDPISCEELHL
jgi:hypothetical protein